MGRSIGLTWSSNAAISFATGNASAAPSTSPMATFDLCMTATQLILDTLRSNNNANSGGMLTDIFITQDDADALLSMEKHRVDDTDYTYPSLGGALRIPLQSLDRRELFVLDITRSQIRLTKGTYQNRARGVVILARLDFGGAPHRNPDDEEIACPHLHVYREGYADKWARPLAPELFSDTTDPWTLLADFMRFVNITEAPMLRRDLFT